MNKYKKYIQIFIIIFVLLLVSFLYNGGVPSNDKNICNIDNEVVENTVDYTSNSEQLSDVECIEKTHEEKTVETEQAGESAPIGTVDIQNQTKTDFAEEQLFDENLTPADDAKSDSVDDNINTPPDTSDDLNTSVAETLPVDEKEDKSLNNTEHTCTLSVRCDTILDNIAYFNSDKLNLLPEDGVIFPSQNVTFYEGESVFNVLLREMKKNKIHLEFVNTPVYNSAYIEGIANIYEFECGELSGWMYRVNGWFPNYGCSLYKLQAGDVVEWVYTCDLGVDVGGGYSAKNGK